MTNKNKNLHELAPDVYATLFPELEDLGNGGIIVTEEGTVIVDTDARTADRILAMLPEITDRGPRYVINSHHAFDHSSGNCIFADRGAAIIASRRCREAMLAHGELNFRRWSDRMPGIRELLVEKRITVAPPNITFDQEMQLHLGKKTIELFHYGHAHSPGDIVIYLPEEQVLFGGDLLWCGFFPNVREAHVPNQIAVIDRILAFPVKCYVPGHGGVTRERGKIVEMRDFLAFLYERIVTAVREGKSLAEAKTMEQPLADAHPDWEGRVFLTTAIEVIYNSLNREDA